MGIGPRIVLSIEEGAVVRQTQRSAIANEAFSGDFDRIFTRVALPIG